MAALFAVLALAGGGVFASRDAVPGDPLYGIKRAAEAAGGIFAGGTSAELHDLDIAVTRLDEIERMARDGVTDAGRVRLGVPGLRQRHRGGRTSGAVRRRRRPVGRRAVGVGDPADRPDVHAAHHVARRGPAGRGRRAAPARPGARPGDRVDGPLRLRSAHVELRATTSVRCPPRAPASPTRRPPAARTAGPDPLPPTGRAPQARRPGIRRQSSSRSGPSRATARIPRCSPASRSGRRRPGRGRGRCLA